MLGVYHHLVMLFFMHVRHNTKLTVRVWQAAPGERTVRGTL